jgi:transposase
MARPTKLTPEVSAVIVENVLHGATYKDASEAAGISYDTFNEWMKAGREATKGKLFEFSEAIEAANAQCAVNFTRVIQSAAAKGDWKAAETWLKRRRRSEWGDNVDVTSGGEKIVITIKGLDDIPAD